MNKKLIGIIIGMLVFVTSFSVTASMNTQDLTDNNMSSLGSTDGSGFELWNKTYGGQGYDLGQSVLQSHDGGYIIVGSTDSYGAGGSDVWLLKTDANGNELWNKTFGYQGSESDASFQQTHDGGYIIVGSTDSYGAGGSDVWLLKTDANGNELWNKTFGGSNNEYGSSVQQTNDNGYIIAGTTFKIDFSISDILLIKTDANGNELWNTTYGGIGDEFSQGVQNTNDGGYIIIGSTNSYGAGSRDVWLIKTATNGTELFNKTYGGAYADESRSIQLTNDGGYIITGWKNIAGVDKVWLIKTDVNGTRVWDKTFTDSGQGYSIRQTTDGGYIVTGLSGAGFGDVLVMKTNTSGTKQWEKNLGLKPESYEMGNSVQQTNDGGYIVLGCTDDLYGSSDMWLIKINREQKLDIGSISGGKGNISVEIKNTGFVDATKVTWNITITGGLFINPRNTSGSLATLTAGGTKEVVMLVFGIGFGIFTLLPKITVSATCAEGSSAEKNVSAKFTLFRGIVVQGG